MIEYLQALLDFGNFFITVLVLTIHSLFYALLQVFHSLVDRVLNGKKQSYETSARFGHILWKKQLHIFDDPTPQSFICLYYSRIHPEYVLQPHVSLYCVTKEEVVFVETPEKVNLYSSDEHPFLYQAQFSRSINIIKMPVKTFHTLAEKLGDPSVPVVWVTSTGRCGSTILCQVFEKIPGTLTLAEPDTPQNIIFMRKDTKISQKEYEDLLKSTIRLLCKPHPGIDRICIKPTPIAVGMMTEMAKLFPNIKHIFMYRNCKETVSSWLALLTSVSALRVTRILVDSETMSTVIPYFRNRLQWHMIYKYKDSQEIPFRNTNTVGALIHMWANYMLIARDVTTHDKSIIPIKFESLLSAPMDTCKVLFEKVGIDTKHLKEAVIAFQKDSHRGSVVSQSRIGKDPRRQIPEADRVTADAVLSNYKLPYMGEDFSL